jgi:hypothetical protein
MLTMNPYRKLLKYGSTQGIIWMPGNNPSWNTSVLVTSNLKVFKVVHSQNKTKRMMVFLCKSRIESEQVRSAQSMWSRDPKFILALPGEFNSSHQLTNRLRHLPLTWATTYNNYPSINLAAKGTNEALARISSIILQEMWPLRMPANLYLTMHLTNSQLQTTSKGFPKILS